MGFIKTGYTIKLSKSNRNRMCRIKYDFFKIRIKVHTDAIVS